MTALTASDYRGALEFVRVAYDVDDGVAFPEHVLAALRRLIPSAMATYHEWEPTNGYRWCLAGADEASVRSVWSGYTDVIDDDPLPGGSPRAARGRSATAGKALMISDFLTLRQFRRLDLHAVVCRPLGIDHVMKLFLATGESGSSIVLDSERRAFSERDRALLEVLAPHLTLIRRRAQRRVIHTAATNLLSPRELEVLELVAKGMTNREIGAEFSIAPGTVRKHLDNVYAKLGVHSRTAAIAAILPPRTSASWQIPADRAA